MTRSLEEKKKGKGPERPEAKKQTETAKCPECGKPMLSPVTCSSVGCGAKVCGVCFRTGHTNNRCVATRSCYA